MRNYIRSHWLSVFLKAAILLPGFDHPECSSERLSLVRIAVWNHHEVRLWCPALRLSGGVDSGVPEIEDAKFAAREAQWQKWREEWEYCTGR